jgi:hypothetical protein
MRGGDRTAYPGARERMIAGSKRSLKEKRAQAAANVAWAARWRDSRRCKSCGALGYVPCVHRPEGADSETVAVPRIEHMPFAGHRTQAQVREGTKVGANSGRGSGKDADLLGSHSEAIARSHGGAH